MRLKSEDNVVISNVKNEKRFTIAATAKAFRILSDGLYSRKIEAIVRELSCNAYDSHVQAGIADRPFVVHLPNAWEPEFSVEDFGLGLSDVEIESIYTSYFTSTKTDSNDVIGALGLGSKTPFSYSDSFTIRSRKDGMEWNYSAFISSTGEPSVSLMAKHETLEENGVKITVPVKTSDFYSFFNDSRKVFSWFVVTPIFTGAELEVNNKDALRLLEDEYFWSTGHSVQKNFITAVMGNVAYHVPNATTTFGDVLSKGEINFLTNNALTIKFEIGDLDVAASRETISFDEDTKEVFLERVRDVVQGFSQKTQDKIDNEADSISEAYNIVLADIGLWANDLFTYKGVSLLEIDNFKTVNDLLSDIVALRGKNSLNSYYYTGYTQCSNDFSKIKFSALASRKLLILQGQQFGYNKLFRTILETNRDCKLAFCTKYVLDEFQKNAIREEFGANNVVFKETEPYLIEQRKVAAEARAKAKEEKRQRAIEKRNHAIAIGAIVVDDTPTVRVKRTEVKIGYYDLATDSIFDEITVDSTFTENCKFVVAEVRRSKIELYNTSFGIDHRESFYNFCMTYGIDKIIMVKTALLEKTKRVLGEGIELNMISRNYALVNWTFCFDAYIVSRIGQRSRKIDFSYVNRNYLVNRILESRGEEYESDVVVAINERLAGYKRVPNSSYIPYPALNRVNFGAFIENITAKYTEVGEEILNKYPLLGSLHSSVSDEKLFEYLDMVDKLQNITVQDDEDEVELSQVA